MTRAPEEVDRLLAVLEAEEKLYLELRDLLQQERSLVLDLDGAGLEDLVRKKEALADEGRFLEESREAIAQELARQLGVDSEPLTLRRLSETLKAEKADGLRRAQARLAALVGSVRELLDANSAVAGEALAEVQATLKVLGRLKPSEPTYGPQFESGEVPNAGRLLRRLA